MNDRPPDPLRDTGLPQPMQGVPQMPVDAQRMGFDSTTPAGQEILFASSFNPRKRWHKVVVWIFLLMIAAVMFMVAFTANLSGSP